MPETVMTPVTSIQSDRQVTLGDVQKESSRDVMDELQRVKAERDLYYDKLLRVRAKVQVAGTTNNRVDTFKSKMEERQNERSRSKTHERKGSTG